LHRGLRQDATGRQNDVALWALAERLAAAAMAVAKQAWWMWQSFGEIGPDHRMRGADGSPVSSLTAPLARARRYRRGHCCRSLGTAAGTLALRGPMVPAHAFRRAPSAGRVTSVVDALASSITGFMCRIERDSQTLVITVAAGITAIGGYHFSAKNAIDCWSRKPTWTPPSSPCPMLSHLALGRQRSGPRQRCGALQARGSIR